LAGPDLSVVVLQRSSHAAEPTGSWNDMPAKIVAHPSLADRRAKGADARISIPPASHTGWALAADRADPVTLLSDQNATREPDLVPVRHGRMMVSPFTFYRGAAKIMAADLAGTPNAGLTVQLCGDAHLSNFGGFASPERKLLFDLNDFDETLPGPFEYDVKRMAASFTIAARNNGMSPAEARDATVTSVRSYREAMAQFAQMGTMELWYTHMSEEDLSAAMNRAAQGNPSSNGKSAKSKPDSKSKSGKDKPKSRTGKETVPLSTNEHALKTAQKALRKAHTRDSLQALSKLGEVVDGRYRIVSQPPVVVPIREWSAMYDLPLDNIDEGVRELFRDYRGTLQDDRRHLLERFEVIDIARKVVGVGSVGTRAFIVLLQGKDESDPLFLQVKEATRSVLEDHLPKSRYHNPGERVVQGQRMMQAASDIYLGWSKGIQADRFFYWRQLRDMKASAVVETMTSFGLGLYAQVCGWTLARAHARSGDVIALNEYLGTDDAFETSIADFSARYADQNERDYQAFTAAVQSGRIPAVQGV
jgi:uncharacterized protein (DUF2252 family)